MLASAPESFTVYDRYTQYGCTRLGLYTLSFNLYIWTQILRTNYSRVPFYLPLVPTVYSTALLKLLYTPYPGIRRRLLLYTHKCLQLHCSLRRKAVVLSDKPFRTNRVDHANQAVVWW